MCTIVIKVLCNSGLVHTTSFLYKKGKKTLPFCESVDTDPHKNATKTGAFENAIKNGYPKNGGF